MNQQLRFWHPFAGWLRMQRYDFRWAGADLDKHYGKPDKQSKVGFGLASLGWVAFG
jgi:hypothetical protein